MSFEIRKLEAEEFAAVLLLDFVEVDFVEVEIFFEALEIFGQERDIRDETRRGRNRHFLEGDALATGQKEVCIRRALAIRAGVLGIDEVPIELVSCRYIRNKNRDAGNAEN